MVVVLRKGPGKTAHLDMTASLRYHAATTAGFSIYLHVDTACEARERSMTHADAPTAWTCAA